MKSAIVPFIILVAPISLWADTTHEIKLKLSVGVGQTTTDTYADTDFGTAKIFDLEGNLIKELKPKPTQRESTTTVLAVGTDGRPTKFVRTYRKDTYTEDDKKHIRTYQGRTLLYEKVGDQWRIGVVGKPDMDGEDVSKLLDMVEKTDDWTLILNRLAPNKAVKVGDEWAIDPKTTLVKLSEYTPDPKRSTITAKLTKVYERGKSKFGTIEVKAKIFVVKALDVMTFSTPATVEHQATVDLAIDGSTTARTIQHTEVIVGKGEFQGADQKGRVELDGKTVSRSERSAETDDSKGLVIPKVVWIAGPDVWIEFESKEAGFRAEFPGQPEKEKADADSITQQFHLLTHQGRIAYMVMVTEGKGQTAEMMANLAAAPSVKEKREIKLDGFAGVEFKHEKKTKPGDLAIVHRAYVVNDRIVQVMFVYDPKLKVDPKRFFDSFKLLDRPKKNDD